MSNSIHCRGARRWCSFGRDSSIVARWGPVGLGHMGNIQGENAEVRSNKSMDYGM